MLEYLLRSSRFRLIHDVPAAFSCLCSRVARSGHDRRHHDPQPRHQKRISGIAVIEKAERLLLKSLVLDLVREHDLPLSVNRLHCSPQHEIFSEDPRLPHLPGHPDLIRSVLPECVHGHLLGRSRPHSPMRRIFHTVHHAVSVDVPETAGKHRTAHDRAHRLIPRRIVGIPPLKSRFCEKT